MHPTKSLNGWTLCAVELQESVEKSNPAPGPLSHELETILCCQGLGKELQCNVQHSNHCETSTADSSDLLFGEPLIGAKSHYVESR
jgi:hypothetical protein